MAGLPRAVLIMDDEPRVLRLVERMLRPRRINVLVAPRAAGGVGSVCGASPTALCWALCLIQTSMPETLVRFRITARTAWT